jgi:hypothetical protein
MISSTISLSTKQKMKAFGKIYKGSTCFSHGITRRLSMMQSTDIAPLNQPGARHLHTIHAFTDYIDIALLKSILAIGDVPKK